MTEKIKITFLGTGQAVPTISRNHTAIFLQYKNENILFDCGEGTQRQFRKVKLNPGKVDRIFISHWHGDHILGIPGLLQTLALSKYPKTLYIYGPRGTKRYMRLMQKMFVHEGSIKIKVQEIKPGKVLDTKDFEIYAESMKHGTPSLAYNFVERGTKRIDKKKLAKLKIKPSKKLGRLKQGKNVKIDGKVLRAKQLTYFQPGRKIGIIMDTKDNQKIVKFAKNSDLMISESTYNEKAKGLASKYKHMTAKQVATAAKKAGAKKLILIHLSQRNEKNPKILLNEAKKIFKNVKIAEDLDQLEI